MINAGYKSHKKSWLGPDTTYVPVHWPRTNTIFFYKFDLEETYGGWPVARLVSM